ncbi:MAG: hypothetical protein V4649_10020 [Bacteroidota bacterium]
MKLRYLLCFLVLGIATAGCAQTKVKTKVKMAAENKSYFKLLEAYTQNTIPGIPGQLVETGHHFVIVWQSKKYPETFFWRGANGWMTCKIEKAQKITTRSAPRGIAYNTEFVTGDDIHKGDTLMLTPVKGGRFPIPAEIPSRAKNTLFFKAGGSNWLSYPVKKIGRKADVPMP